MSEWDVYCRDCDACVLACDLPDYALIELRTLCRDVLPKLAPMAETFPEARVQLESLGIHWTSRGGCGTNYLTLGDLAGHVGHQFKPYSAGRRRYDEVCDATGSCPSCGNELACGLREGHPGDHDLRRRR